MYKFTQSHGASKIFNKLSEVNLGSSNESLKLTVELLYNHATIMSKVFKRDIEDMLSEININIADNIKEIAEISPEVTRYFQLVGQNSNLV
ncbi:hypothetical protein LMH73_026315, partial [Vibrio splendidus]